MRDGSQDYFVDGELIEYVNDAVADLVARERLVREVASVVVAGGVLPLPTDLLQVRWVSNPSGTEVAWMDESTFFAYKSDAPDWDEEIPLATVYDDTVWIHPAPADGESWAMGYYQTPAAISVDSEDFPLRRVHEARVVHYVRGQCYYRLGEMELGDREIQQYEAGLRPAQAVTDHQVPGRVSLAREANAFDADPESIHRGR